MAYSRQTPLEVKRPKKTHRENKPLTGQKGVIVVIAFLALGILLLLSAYLLSFTIVESKTAASFGVSIKTYYLAEAGIQEAIWKLKNDQIWKDGFVTEPTCQTWQTSFTRNYSANTTTTVSIQNSQCARGEIIATSVVSMSGGKTAQRVVKVKVLKSLGSLTEDSPIFTGAPSGESAIRASIMNIYNGNIFINNNFNIKHWSQVSVDGKALITGNSIVSSESILNADSICAKNICQTTSTCACSDPEKFDECSQNSCPPKSFSMPTVDFDSPDPASYKSRAQAAKSQGQCHIVGKNAQEVTVLVNTNCLFSGREFENLLWMVGRGGKLILEHETNGSAVSTYYVEGGVDLEGGRSLEINGVLIADSTVNIGEKSQWRGNYGFNQLTINDPGVGFPSGLLTKSKINIGPYAAFQDVEITGLIYSQDEIRIVSVLKVINVTGGIISRKFSLTSIWNNLNIYLDNDIIKEGVWGGLIPPGGLKPPYSPVVTVEHWEESY
ncbi:MAG: hypothetical protein ABIB55_00200 [Candidatus Nealsonbacteria bacterium]